MLHSSFFQVFSSFALRSLRTGAEPLILHILAMRFITVVSDQITQAFAVLGAEELSDETAGALVEAVAQFLSGVVGLENGLMGVCEKTGTKRKQKKKFFFFCSFHASYCGSSWCARVDCFYARCGEE
jgi:hypothetical protein